MNSIEHPVLDLWKRHHPLAYPDGVVPVDRPIPGLAFFPGGYGLWDSKSGADLHEFPNGGLMIVGHDFHSEAGYKASLTRGRELETQPTWRNLLKTLRAAEISLEKCFFTNFYMGLRKGEATTGIFPGAKDEPFRRHCSEFFIEQLKMMRPSVIVTLGKYVPVLVASLSPDLEGWRASEGFRQIDEAGAVRRHCRFDGVSAFEAAVVALTHPSMRDASIRRRCYKDRRGNEAEMAMLKDALSGSPLLAESGRSAPQETNQ